MGVDAKCINECPEKCVNNPCSREEAKFCRNYDDGTNNGCTQCISNYFSAGPDQQCTHCQEYFGVECIHCDNKQGCQQCSSGAPPVLNQKCGLYYCDDGTGCDNNVNVMTETEAASVVGETITDIIESEQFEEYLRNILTGTTSVEFEDTYPLTDVEESSLRIAFDTFDLNDDSEWSMDEFIRFLRQSSPIDEKFDLMDIDNDGIISFREMIVYLKALDDESNESDSTSSIFEYWIDPDLNRMFHKEKCCQIKPYGEDDTWYEYAAAYFFKRYDPHHKGYVTRDGYLSFEVTDLFNGVDIDSSDSIDFDEFVASGFSFTGLSTLWGFNVFSDSNDNSNHSNYSSGLDSLSSLSESDVYAQEIYDCPNMNLINPYESLYDGDDGDDIDQHRRQLLIQFGANWETVNCIGRSAACGMAVGGCIACVKSAVATAGATSYFCKWGCTGGIGFACSGALTACGVSPSDYTGSLPNCYPSRWDIC